MPPGTGPLPLLVGVTGHRDLREVDRPGLRDRVRETLARLRRELPHTPLVLLSSLAEGADRLVAVEALAVGARLHVPLPLPLAEYQTDFRTAESLAEFDGLLARAESVFEVPTTDPDDPRSQRYHRAGEFVAEHCQLLIALWDGSGAGKPGGTAEIVRRRLTILPQESATQLHPPDPAKGGPVLQVVTPRSGDPVPDNPLSVVEHLPTGWRNDPVPAGSYRKIRGDIDAFNVVAADLSPSEQAAVAGRKHDLWPADAGPLPPGQEFTRTLLATADVLAVRYRNWVKLTVAAICLLVFLAVAAYEVTGHLFHVQQYGLLIYPALLAVAFLIYRWAESLQFASRYHDYRALAEGLRVQFFWRQAGIRRPVEAYYLRRQRRELNWIRTGLRIAWSLQGGDLPTTERPDDRRRAGVLANWVDDQRRYFAARTPREEATERAFSLGIRLTVAAALVLSVVVGALLAYPEAIGSEAAHWLHDHPFVERVLVLCTSMPLVVAAMLHAYRRSVELKGHVRQYEALDHLFATAQARLATAPDDEVQPILEELGQDALAENADWVLMNRDRPMEVPTGR